MPQQTNEEWLDALIRHQIGLMRLSGSVRNQIIELLDATEGDIREQIKRRLSRSQSVSSQENLIQAIKKIRNQGWVQSKEVWRNELRAMAKAEPLFLQQALQTVAPVQLALELPTPQNLAGLITHHPFEGQTLAEWASQLQRQDLRRIEQQIRIGIVQGESSDAIARRVVGTAQFKGKNGATQITRNAAAAITRTAVNSYANAAKRQFYNANADLFDMELYVATLDSRTTPICRSLDGKQFPVGEGPIPPLHWNCRSLRVAVIDGDVLGERPMKAVTEQQLRREWDGKGSFDKFARRRIRELTGTVDAKVSYQQWLNRQSATFQNDILGPTRGKLFRKGDLSLDKFVNRAGDELTLSELAQTERAAFIAAGLDPDNFL